MQKAKEILVGIGVLIGVVGALVMALWWDAGTFMEIASEIRDKLKSNKEK